MPTPTHIEDVARRLSRTSFLRFRTGLQTERIDTKWLGFLTLESLRKYYKVISKDQSQDLFGNVDLSFNKAMKQMFIEIGGLDRTRKTNLKNLIAAYEKDHRGELGKQGSPDKPTPTAKYLERIADVKFSDCVAQMYKDKFIGKNIKLDDAPSIEDQQCRHIRAILTDVYCRDDSEWSSDEPYLITGASLSDFTGVWFKKTGCSNIHGNVDPGDHINFTPPSINKLFDWRVVNPSDELSLWPVTALCTITLMEHDQSDQDRVYQAFKAAYSTARLLVAISTGSAGGPVGVAIALACIFISVILALDGDDELSTIPIRIDDVLGGDAIPEQNLIERIKGRHKGNNYKYDFSIKITGEDYSCPVPAPFGIIGPSSRMIPYRGGVTFGGYSISCPDALHMISWRVSPAGASIGQQEKRYTKISFHREGQYKVLVTAKSRGGIPKTYEDEISVSVDVGSGIPH